MLPMQEISDRLEILDLVASYSDAIDRRDFDALDDVFTPDALIDYTAFAAGARGDRAWAKDFLIKSMEMFGKYYHMAATSKIKIDGDTATGRTICHNPMVFKGEDGTEHLFTCGLWYIDRYRRTPEGWRITSRVEEKAFLQDYPEELAKKVRA